jgi:hypothetical protein
MKLTHRFVFSILIFFSMTAVFSHDFSDQEIGFDVLKNTASLKQRGVADQNINREIAMMRGIYKKQYSAIKKKEDEILQKITSAQVFKAETIKTANSGLTSKTVNTLVDTDIPQTEKDALLALYNSTNGSNWTKKTGWDFSTPVTSWNSTTQTGWYGITVNEGHIVGIELYNNQLSGRLPAEIGQLTQLNSLNLANNQLNGWIIPEIGYLTNLQALNLDYNQITGITTEIKYLKLLQEFYIGHNKISSIPNEIGQLDNLWNFYIDHNQLSGSLPTGIVELPRIEQIHLEGNQLSGTLIDLGFLTTLNELHIYGNNFRFVDFASQFSSLKDRLWNGFYYDRQSKTDTEKTVNKIVGETQTLTMYEDNRFTPSDTYQWYKGGQAIVGATNRQYTLSNLTLANAGDYYCVSTNPQMTLLADNYQNLVLTRNTIHLNVIIPPGDEIHNFTLSGNSSSFYSISGNLSTFKGTVTYNGLTLTQCLKMETATSISYTTKVPSTLTLVFVETAPTIKVDGINYTGSGGIITVNLAAGSHTIMKQITANLFYVSTKYISPINNNQTVTCGAAISPIVYAWGGSTTDITVTGLPASGISFVKDATAKTITISGTPTANVSYSISITGTGGTLATSSGAVTVIIPPGDEIHNFTSSGGSSPFYSISGTLSTFKGTVTYDGLTLTQCLKMETATSISYTTRASSTLTLVFVETAPTIKIDGINYTGSGGMITVNLAAGSHTITKQNTANLFYVSTKYIFPTNNNQTVTCGTPISSIVYAWGPSTTDVTVTGLPASGISFIKDATAKTITISGTPTAAGTIPYTITLIGGCRTVTATGSITVATNNITLTSATGTDNQIKNKNTAIINITYATTGGTGADITGLPAGVTGSFASNIITISGTPTVSGIFNYLVTLIGGCGTTATGRITTSCEPITGIIKIMPTGCKANVTANQSSQNIASGQITALTLTSTTVGTTFNWTVVQSGVTGAAAGTGSAINQMLTNTGTTNGTATYTITPVFENCSGTPIVIVVTVTPQAPYIGIRSASCRNVGTCNDNSSCGVEIPIAHFNAPAGSYITLTVNGSQSVSLTMSHISDQFYKLTYLESNAVNASVNFTLYLKDSTGNIIYYTNESLSHQSSWAIVNSCNQ